MDSSFMSQAMQGGDLGSATATMELSAYYYQYNTLILIQRCMSTAGPYLYEPPSCIS